MFFTMRQKLLIVFVHFVWYYQPKLKLKLASFSYLHEQIREIKFSLFSDFRCCCLLLLLTKKRRDDEASEKKNNSNESQLGERIWNETTKCNFSNREIVCTFDHTWTLEAVQFAEFQFRVSSFHSINSISLRAAIFKSFGEQLHTPHNSTTAFNFIRQWKISNFTEYYCSIYSSSSQ